MTSTLDQLSLELAVARSRDEARSPLDEVAKLAADGDGYAVEVLLAAIDRLELARPAIARQLFNLEDQRDVEQDVLVAVATSIGSFRGEASVLTWLQTVATNCSLRFVERRRDALSLDQPNSFEPSWSERFTSLAADRMLVQRAIAELPEHHRVAVTLRDIEHLSYAEIAERLELNINTVRAHIARGRASVSEELGGSVPEMEAP